MPLKIARILEEQPRARPLPTRVSRDGYFGSFSGEILINCPVTNKPVTTGLKSEWVVFKSLPAVAVPLRCPACGKTHNWKPVDAWVEPPLLASNPSVS